MARSHNPLLTFNRGEVTRYSLARTDVERLRLSAEEQINFAPWVIGPMMLRPGMKYCGATRGNNAARLLPFVFSNDDLALLELTDSNLRVWLVGDDSETLVTRASVSTVVTNGDFSSGTGWTTTTTGTGATASISGGKLTLASPAAGGLAQAKRSVTVSSGDQNVRHAFYIVVDRGPVTFRAGSSDGADDYISQTTLETGYHSLAFTPTGGTVYIQLETDTAQSKIVDQITIASSGVMTLATPWAASDIENIRVAQSGDVVFVACPGYQQRRIERRSTYGWSVVLYKSDDGPFLTSNTSQITLTPSALKGNTTLTASKALFKSTQVGALFRLFSAGQNRADALCAENRYTTAIRVTGSNTTERSFTYEVTGTFSGTMQLQRSLDGPDYGFIDVGTAISTTVTPTSYYDNTPNVVCWYRMGFKPGAYTSGTATVNIVYAGGGGAGLCRVTAFSSSTSVSVEVLSPFHSLTGTLDWNEAEWSDYRGWPSAVEFYDGRLWWAGRDKLWGSVSDAYNSFDIDTTGDAGPINRSIGFGPVDRINFLLGLSRLVVGRQGAETSVRSGSFDEPLTPTNFTLKDCSTQGSTSLQAVKIDTRGVFVQQSNRRVFELGFSVEAQDYTAKDLTRLNTDIGLPGFVDIAVQRQPDTQIHLVRDDGVVAVFLHDVDDGVDAWWRLETDGEVENVAVLPGTIENRVYYIVKRTVNGSTVRYIERMARRDQCGGLPENRQADSHVIYSGSATTTITGLSHLEGCDVAVWGWNTSSPFTVTLPDGSTETVGKDFGTFTVSGGQITGLASQVTDACIGLSYEATFKSTKLAYAAQMGTALSQVKKVDRVGLVLADSHYQGIEFGQSFTNMDSPPLVSDGMELNDATVWENIDGRLVTVPSDWSTDSRLCLRATAPKPCMVLAAVVDVMTNEN